MFDQVWISLEHILAVAAFICLGLLAVGIWLDFLYIRRKKKNPFKEGF
jgi:hypothetical protein